MFNLHRSIERHENALNSKVWTHRFVLLLVTFLSLILTTECQKSIRIVQKAHQPVASSLESKSERFQHFRKKKHENRSCASTSTVLTISLDGKDDQQDILDKQIAPHTLSFSSSLSSSSAAKLCNFNFSTNAKKSKMNSEIRGGASSSHPYVRSSMGIIAQLRVALAGGIAGATGTVILYPIDTAKTLRQADPARYTSVPMALRDLLLGVAGDGKAMGLRKAYSGVIAASFFSIPSSALYFGAYEYSKQRLTSLVNCINQKSLSSSSNAKKTPPPDARQRLFIHALSAITGNTCSSLLFVPKEFIKQQMQAYGSGAMRMTQEHGKSLIQKHGLSRSSIKLVSMRHIIKNTMRDKGIGGFYSGYKATLMRNIPSAVMRFAIYEELKLRWLGEDEYANNGGGISPIFFVSGAMAGALASGLMTPMDVLKTRISTNTIPPNLGLAKNIQWILRENGWQGLYAGVKARMVWSGAFSAIGFGTFEAAKNFLGVNDHIYPKNDQ